MHQTLATTPLDSNHPDKVRLLKAVRLTRAVLDHPALRFAIADFYAARREVGPYLGFYAFRVLEDIGFHFGVTKDDKPDWDTMNAAIGTAKDKWQPLTKAGTSARHLSKHKIEKLKAIDCQELLVLAHEAVGLALKTIHEMKR